MITLLVGTLVGVALGTVSGLVPGVHVNTLSGLLISMQLLLLPLFGAEGLAMAMVAALVTHAFLDTIPSTFLGVPDADTALAVLPAHALCLEGKGEEAVRISALGSALGVATSIPLAIVFFFIFPPLQPLLDWGIGIVLIAVMGYLIVTSDAPAWSMGVFFVSGLLGIFSLKFSYLGWNLSGGSSILMPLLSGLFGVSVLLFATSSKPPSQKFSAITMDWSSIKRGTALGTLAGAIVGWLPGLSNATANAFLASLLNLTTDRRSYLLATSAANTANAFLGIAAFYAISRERNGVMAAIATISPPPMADLLAAGVVASLIAYVLTVRIAGIAPHLHHLGGRTTNLAVVLFVTALSLILCGPFGLCILLLATLTGIVPALVNIPRITCMGAITLPVILYSFGIAL
ncbi:MAG: tripartite tricarboxylate transporter permease [Methanomicrobiales archaeon]|jgi:putative membrane protein|nr:tripartite tricarboxylate transporter permease [Methanomicrobiales archaeon]